MCLMHKMVTFEKFKRMIDMREDIVLVNVLSKESYSEKHIPGLMNKYPVAKIEERAGKDILKSKIIVVYCASFECQASPNAAKK